MLLMRLTKAMASRMAMALVTGLASLPLWAADIKIATVAPEGSGWMKDLRGAAQDVRTRTDGRVMLKFYGGGVQGNEKQVLRKIRIGQLQGGVFTSNDLAERYPDIILYGLPMLFDSQDEVDFVRKRMDATLASGLEKAGFASYGFAGGGFAYLMADKSVARLEDLRGQKIWVPEGDQSSYVAMQALQLSPVVLPVTDVLTGLETGLLNIVATPPVGAVVLQWYTKVKYVMNQPLSYTTGLLAIDQRALVNVSPADLAALRDVLVKLYIHFDEQNRQDNAKAEQALRANGLKFVTPDAAEVPRWRQAVAGATDKLAADGVFSAALLKEVRQYIQDYRASSAGGKVPGGSR